MTSRKIFGHRDGFTADSVLAIGDLTTGNPIFTAGLLAFFIRKAKAPINLKLLGWLLTRRNRTWGISISGVLFLLSLLKRGSDALSWRARNNGVVDKYDWAREVVLVTGASSGIGARVCQMLSERGIKIAGLDVQEPLYALPERMRFYKCDITNQEQLAEVGARVRADLGEVTVLLNNAGIGKGLPILDIAPNHIHATMNVNAISHFFTVKEFLPYMVKRNHGHVITVASMASYVSPPGIAAYGMSKAAALAFHESLTMELKFHHETPAVRTSVINPLWVATPLLEAGISGDPSGKQGPPAMHVDTIAETIANVILSGESQHCIVPRSKTIASALRGMPDWFHWQAMESSARDMALFDREKAGK